MLPLHYGHAIMHFLLEVLFQSQGSERLLDPSCKEEKCIHNLRFVLHFCNLSRASARLLLSCAFSFFLSCEQVLLCSPGALLQSAVSHIGIGRV